MTPDTRDRVRIPVIDLSVGTSESQAELIGAALAATGFFSLVGHGVPQRTVDAAFDASRRFFTQSDAAKAQVHIQKSRHKHGFDPVGWQALDTSAPPDLKESFYLGAERALDHPLVLQGIENQGPNQWPDEEKVPGFRAACDAYSLRMDALARRLLALIAMSLNLPPTHFEPFMRDPSCTTRLLHYPAQPPQPRSAQLGQIGCGAHTDWGAITVLAQDDAGGLQARLPDGSWQAIDPIPGGLVVNSGDMLQRWTNDRYLSNVHRVVNQASDRERYSIAYFFDLDHHAVIEALPTCVSAQQPAKYPPIKAGEHLIEMYRKTTVAL
jgi:isopenicillin N synthase-like dioxygenase